MRSLLFLLAALMAIEPGLRAAPPEADLAPWQPLYPNATPGLFGSFQAPSPTPAEYLLWAKERQVVTFSIAVRAPARSRTAVAAVTPQITSPSAKAVTTESKGPAAQTVHQFTAREAGVYRVQVEPNGLPITVNSASAPLCRIAQNGALHFSGATVDLYFLVPAGTAGFSIEVGLDGTGKFKATLFDAQGHLRWNPVGDIEGDNGADLVREDPTRAEVWRIRLEAPSAGPCADYHLALKGAPTVFAASPEALLGPAAGGPPPIHAPRILLVGDSLMANCPKPPPERPLLTGWGQVLPEFFHPGVVIDNRAASGASERSFLERGSWIEALKQPFDYVLIAFGGNDEKWGERYADPATSFRDYLRAFVYMARARGIQPILATDTARRTFGPDGKITTTQRPYVEAIQAVADELHVPFINLLDPSIAFCEKVGEKECEKFSPGEDDRAHYSREFALKVAQWAAEGLLAKVPELRPVMKGAQEWP
jgi:lysophospholipase L1-like esterase